MGRAIVRSPAAFLFDEPLSNLDAKLRVQMRAELKEIHRRLQTTTIYVTHDQIEAMTMADRIVVMRGGTVEQIGPPLDLYDRPANLFVAGFIGSPAMNLLDGENAGRVARLPGGAEIAHPLDAPDGKVVVGIRPEHLTVAAEGAGLPARVTEVEPTGLDTLIVADAGGQVVQAYVRERTTLGPGDPVTFSVAPDHVHLFDPVTTLRHG
jgi:multiple sugar transport system ATP-binding protein